MSHRGLFRLRAINDKNPFNAESHGQYYRHDLGKCKFQGLETPVEEKRNLNCVPTDANQRKSIFNRISISVLAIRFPIEPNFHCWDVCNEN